MNCSRTRSELQLTIAHTPPPFHLAQLLSALCSLLRCRFQLLSLDTSIELDMGWILLPTEQLQLVSWMVGNLAQPPTCDSGSRRVSVSRVSVNCRVKWYSISEYLRHSGSLSLYESKKAP